MDRFWKKVAKTEGCWLWTAARDSHGYGNFSFSRKDKVAVFKKAHQVAWFLTFGAWPQMHVLHRCDVPACVNPAHLFEGSQQDNMLDMIAKGRKRGGARSGVANHNATLDCEKVIEMRRLYEVERRSQTEIARAFDVGTGVVNHVVHRKQWKCC